MMRAYTIEEIKKLAGEFEITLLVTDEELLSVNWGKPEEDDSFEVEDNGLALVFIEKGTNRRIAKGLILQMFDFVIKLQ